MNWPNLNGMTLSSLLHLCTEVRKVSPLRLHSNLIPSCPGGADTTVSAQYAFFLAMVLYPGESPESLSLDLEANRTVDVQRKIKDEIETVVGSDRLPNHDDRPNMPYTNAVISEILRWNSVAPSGKHLGRHLT